MRATKSTAACTALQTSALSITDLSSETLAAEQAGHVDPYVLAARYCHKFANIHPFADGNDRMCRLILNSLLFKYAGVFCVLGENEQAKDEYLSIAARGSQADQSWKEADEEEAAFKRPTGGGANLLRLFYASRRRTCKKSSATR